MDVPLPSPGITGLAVESILKNLTNAGGKNACILIQGYELDKDKVVTDLVDENAPRLVVRQSGEVVSQAIQVDLGGD